ncbi:MAG: hypothetical protein AB7O04_08180 [Hyphomonadaceae bacterium]
MSLVDLGVWTLRFFGLLYFLFGLWGAWAAWRWSWLDGAAAKLHRMAEEIAAESGEKLPPGRYDPPDPHRSIWIVSGALIVAAAGAMMLIAHRLAVPLLALIILHQLLYFIRQRRRELAAVTRGAAEDARPARATVNGFFAGLLMAVLAAWLYWQGALI